MHSLSVYAEKVMQLFRGCKLEDLPPHIYATAQSAYRALLRTRKDQVRELDFGGVLTIVMKNKIK